MGDSYILDGHTPKRCHGAIEWSRLAQAENRLVALDEINGVTISTVFLHNLSGIGAPILFETMVFGGTLDEECERYTTREDAEAGHALMVERVRESETWPTEPNSDLA
jgi:hypothetical protein